ncbi:aspartate-semialdehyde dehydrogenase, partial [bacterium]|nr:aspartate-semialdehyde dehydrogenase [bacterium]
MPEPVRIALVGATGMVGHTALFVLSERRSFPIDLRVFATERSKRRALPFGDGTVAVEAIPDTPPDVDFALFAAPGEVARELAPLWANAGIHIVDNSSEFRMTEGVPLVVPEVNAEAIAHAGRLIANPNCSTIQLAVAVAPLERAFGIEDLSVATYQSVSGAGAEVVERWQLEVDGGHGGRSPLPAPIHGNVIPSIGEEDEHCRYTTEEHKMLSELPKILGRDLSVSVT